MRFQPLRIAIFVLLFSFLLSNQILFSQTPQPPDANASKPSDSAAADDFVLKASTHLVVVDVSVRDKQGRPVTGLTANDFSVSENGKPQKIASLTYFDAQTPRPPVPPLPANVFSNRPTEVMQAGQSTVLLIDALNTTIQQQTDARKQVLSFLDKYNGARPLAIYVLGRKLTILQNFTTDKKLLKAAVQSFKSSASAAVDQPGSQFEFQLPKYDPQMEAAIAAQIAQERMLHDQVRARYTMDAMTSVASYIAGYPGRKTIIWISPAFPINAEKDQFHTFVNRLANMEVTVYSVNPRMLMPDQPTAVDTERTQYGRNMGGPEATDDFSRRSLEQTANDATLRSVAEGTGGKAFINGNQLDLELLQAVDDGAYYSLSYYPTNRNFDGGFREIQIKVPAQRYDLSYRRGYLALDFDKDAKEREDNDGRMLSSLRLGTAPSTQVIYNLQVVPNGDKLKLRFTVEVHRLKFSTSSDGKIEASLDLAAAVYTPEGQPVLTDGFSAKVDFTPEQLKQAQAGGVTVNRPLNLAPGNYIIRTAVRDLNSGAMGSLEVATKAAPATAAPGAH